MLGILGLNRLVFPLVIAAASAAIVFWTYREGVDAGKRGLLLEIEQSRLESIQEKERINDEIRNLPEDELLDRALGAVRVR